MKWTAHKMVPVLFLISFAALTLSGQNSLPVITNVNAEVRPDGRLVDISYDVADSEGDSLYIEVQIELGGSGIVTHTESLTGDVGGGILPGAGKLVTWNAAHDFPSTLIEQLYIIIYATDNRLTGGSADIIDDGYGTYLRVPAGAFWMGADAGQGYPAAAVPRHRVYLDEYYIGKFEITNADFVQFVEDNGYSIQDYWTAGGFGTAFPTGYAQMVLPENANFPANNISWYAAQAYCKWLSSKTSHTYSLPTEAEWEKAARGTDERVYPHGNTLHGGYANYQDSGDPYDNAVTPVGFYDGTFYEAYNLTTQNAVSPYGAYDMCGNVVEMCLDWYDNYYYQTCQNLGTVINPTGPSAGDFVGEYYVMKGGAYFTPRTSQYLKAGGKTNGLVSGGWGFRCVIRQSNGTREKSNPISIDTRILAELKALEIGPSPSDVKIPANGTAYVYQEISSGGNLLYQEDTVAIRLRNSYSQAVDIKGHFLKSGLLRMDLPYSAFNKFSNRVFYFPDTLRLDTTVYSFNEPRPSYNIGFIPSTYTRSWDIFAGRSAGANGSIGSIGLGASASIAKVSVSGEGGIGLRIQSNENNDLAIERRVEYGISEELEAPQVNYVVGKVNVGKAGVSVKTVIGQSFQFSDLAMDEDLKRMAQSGFMLETFSLAGLAVSPFTGIVLAAVIETINTLGNVNSVFSSAAVQDYWGAGVEGSFGAGLKFVVGEELEYNVFDESFGGAVQAKYVNKHRNPGTKGAGNKLAAGDAGTALELELAASYNISLLPFSFDLFDGVELGSGNFSLFDGGVGGSLGFGADRNSEGAFEAFSIALKGGGEYSVLGDKENIYYNTRLEFSAEHLNTLRTSTTGMAKLFGNSAIIPLSPGMLAQDASAALDEVINAAGQYPVRISTAETRGRPYELGLGISFDIAAGVGIGGSLGVKGSYFDELEYPRKITDVYIGKQNYLLYSSEYNESMHSAQLPDILETLFSGTVPLIQEALNNLIAITEKTLQAGEAFVLELFSEAGTKVGELVGEASEILGKISTGVFSASAPMITQKAFSPPEVRGTYMSSEVYHRTGNDSRKIEDAPAGTVLTLVSESLTVSFLTEGESVPVDLPDTSIILKMIIHEDHLLANGFTGEDRDRVKIFYYEPDSVGWILEGGRQEADTVSVAIKRSGTYALGIELDLGVDGKAPEVYSWGTSPGLPDDMTPLIFAHVADDRYGSGLDLAGSGLVLNGDTLDSYYDPANNMIFFQVPDTDPLGTGTYAVEIFAADIAGNESKENFTFILEESSTYVEVMNGDRAITTGNYPNPFTGRTTITVDLPVEESIEIYLYDNRGAYIKMLASGPYPQGRNSFTWDGTDGYGNRVAPGVYFYQVKWKDQNIVRKMQYIDTP